MSTQVSTFNRLSKLQRHILLVMLERYESPLVKGKWTHRTVHNAEFLFRCFGWDPDGGRRGRLPRRLRGQPSQEKLREHGQNFSRVTAGRKYNSAHASLSRTLRRLAERGLIQDHFETGNLLGHEITTFTGVELTEAGVVVAQKVKAQSDPPESPAIAA